MAKKKAAAPPKKLSPSAQRRADLSAAKKHAKATYDGGALPPEKAKLLGWTGPLQRHGDGSVVPLR